MFFWCKRYPKFAPPALSYCALLHAWFKLCALQHWQLPRRFLKCANRRKGGTVKHAWNAYIDIIDLEDPCSSQQNRTNRMKLIPRHLYKLIFRMSHCCLDLPRQCLRPEDHRGPPTDSACSASDLFVLLNSLLTALSTWTVTRSDMMFHPGRQSAISLLMKCWMSWTRRRPNCCFSKPMTLC